MKHIFYLIGLFALLTGCSSSKNYLAQADGDKALFEVLEKLDKQANSKRAVEALPILYANAQKRYLSKVAGFNNLTDISRWDSIVTAYQVLQEMYTAINTSFTGGRLVRPTNYRKEIDDAKQLAAEAYYQLGTTSMAASSKENAVKAWRAFKKTNQFVPGYKDAPQKLQEAYPGAVMNIVFLPMDDKVYKNGITTTANNNTNQQFIIDLAGMASNMLSKHYPIKFYIANQLDLINITPDWAIQLTLMEMTVQGPTTDSYTSHETKQIIKGYDTSRNAIMETLDAWITRHTQRLRVNMEMKMEIIEATTGHNIASHKYPELYSWEYEYGTYTGDAMALSANSSALVNRRSAQQPNIESVNRMLYSKISQKITDRIVLAVKEYNNQ